MTARCAACAVAAALAAPAAASAAEVAVNRECYVEKAGTVEVTGSGFTPGSATTLVLGSATATVTPDATGAISAGLTPPSASLKHPGARQLTLFATDSTGIAASTPVNVAKVGVDGVPSVSRPHRRIMWNIAGFPSSSKALYGHWRFHGKTRANRRLGVPKGPCGVLHVRARQIEAKRVRFGIWVVQFDLNRAYDRHAAPVARRKILVSRTFS